MPPILGNNSFETAKEILSPAFSTKEESGSLSSAAGGDLTDFFKFTLTGSSSISLSLNGLSGNARLRAFSAPNETSEITPAGTSNPQRLSESIILNSVQPGTYYVKVDLDPTDAKATSADYTLKVAANTSLNTSSILWRSTDGTNGVWLINGKELEVGLTPQKTSNWRPTVGDFNGDKEEDIFWQNTTDGALELWLMQGKTILEVGTPKFNNQAPFVVGSWQSYAGDFDGNGKSDLFWLNATSGETAVWLMNGTTILDTNFTAALGARTAWRPQIADFDGNGNDDILWRNDSEQAASVWIMQGKSLESPTSYSYFDNIPAAWVPKPVTLTTDGKVGIFWRNTSSGQNGLWIMSGKDRQDLDFLPSVPSTWTPKTGDFDGDGITDLFWRDAATGANGIWRLDGARGSEQKRASFGFLPSAPESWKVEEIADFNGDNKDDLLWRNSADGMVGIWLIDASGTKLTDGTARADFSIFSNRVPNDYKVDGILDRDLINKPQSISGATEATAFNVGTLNTGTSVTPETPGAYRDSVTAQAPDFFKFSISTLSNFTATLTGSATLELLKQGATGTPSAPVTYTAGMELGIGTYFVKVVTTANTSTAYSLSLLGTPQLVEVLGESFTTQTPIQLDEPSTAIPNPTTKVNVNYSIRNGGTIAVSGVKVNFVISRDSVIDVNDPIIGTDTITTAIAAGTPSAVRTSQVTLPDLENTFWTVDKDYYIGVIIDPDNTLTETNEGNNFGVAVSKDYAVAAVTRTITADPKAVALNVTNAAPKAGTTLTGTYQIGNGGNKVITDDNKVTTRFYLSQDTNFRLSDGDFDFPRVTNAIGKKVTLDPAPFSLALPDKTDPVWQGLTGNQTFFIGMVVNDGGGVIESDDTNNILFREILVDLT